jgi:5-(carboxyamino)imidazole ribonucleotide mutase
VCNGKYFRDGIDSLLSILQMPMGVPVATAVIDDGKSAGLIAARILSIKYPQKRIY